MRHSKKNGFVLLYAALVISALLTIGTGLATLARKQIVVTAARRDAEQAFFIADNGAECAFFWDRKFFLINRSLSVFAANDIEKASAPAPSGAVKCTGIDIVANGGPANGPWSVSTTLTTGITSFSITDAASGSCAQVTVNKAPGGPTGTITTVTSVGLVKCADPTTIRRTVVSTY